MAATCTINRISGAVINEGDTLQMSVTVSGAAGGEKLNIYFSNQYAGAFTTALQTGIATSAAANGCTVVANSFDNVTVTLGAGSYTLAFNRTVGTQIGGTGDAATWAAGSQRQIDVFLSAGSPAPTISGNVQSVWVTYTVPPSGLPALSGVYPTKINPTFSFAPGVNIAGAEFGSAIWPSNARVDWAVAEGYKIIRVPFLASRVINTATSPWSAGGGLETLASVVTYITSKGIIALVDMHDYGRTATGGLIGVDGNANENFAMSWRIVANRLKGISSNICYGLSNEPNAQSATAWLSGANLAIAHIRDVQAGQPIFVMGSYWGGAHAWNSNDNNSVMLGVSDPISNVVIEAHEYFDNDFSGTHYDDASLAPGSGDSYMTYFTGWLRSNGFKGFIGEFGVQATTAGITKMGQMLDHIVANKDVYAGWAYWAAGPWGSYPFSVDADLGLTAQEVKLRTYSAQAVSGGAMGTGGPSSGPPPPPPILTVQIAATEPSDAVSIAAIGPGVVALNFTAAIPPEATVASSPVGVAQKLDGSFQSFAAGVGRRTDRGLLIEPAATNYIANSKTPGGSGFTAINAPTTSLVAAPDGTNTAVRCSTTASIAGWYFSHPMTGQQVTMSVYVRPISGSAELLLGNDKSGAAAIGHFVTDTLATSNEGSATNSTVEAIGGGWYRFRVTLTPASGLAICYWTGTGTLDLWQLQMEAGSNTATSPIFSGGSPTTRSADAVNFVIPSNVSQITYTFDDGSTQSASVSPGSFTIPTNLSRPYIKSIASPASGITLAATEPADVAAFTASTTVFATMAVTEPPDAAAFTAAAYTATLAVTEPSDAVSIAVAITGSSNVTWDPNAKAADIALSNGNKTFTKTADSDHGVMATFGITNQLIYAELELVGANNAGYVFGLVNGSYNVNTYPGQGATGFGALDGGDIRNAGANVGASGRLGVVPSNGRMAIAVNGSTRQAWWKNLGSSVADWNGTSGASPSGTTPASPTLPATVKVYAEGDSNTSGAGAGGTSNAYPALGQPLLSTGPTYTVQNAGTAGISLPTILSNFASRGGAGYDATKALNVFSIMAGTNTSGSSDTTAAQKYLILRDILRAARKAGYQRTVVMTYIPRGDNVSYWTGTLVPFNQSIREMFNADLYADALVDPCSDPHLTDNTSTADTTYYNTDLLHVTAAGEQLIANKYAPGVNSVLAAAGVRVRGPMTLHPYDTKNVTLSNGNRTITVPSGFGTCYARAVNGDKTGKWAWEDKIDVLANNATVGVTNALFNSFYGEPGTTTDSFGYTNAGAIRTNAATVATADSFTSGDIIQHRLDLDAKLWWVRRVRAGTPGNWNGNASASPTSGIGGIDISGIFRTVAAAGDDRIFPIVRINSGTDQVTVSYASAQLSAAPDTGYSAWDAPITDGAPISVTLDFTKGIPAGVSVVSPAGYAKKSDGTLAGFAANAGRRTDLGILIEPASTNLLPYSQQIDLGWTPNGVTVTANAGVAPDGTTTADKSVEQSGQTSKNIMASSGVGVAAGTYTVSYYVKPSGWTGTVGIEALSAATVSGAYLGAFNPSTGAFTAAPGAFGTGISVVGRTFEALANGWYRLILVFSTSGAFTLTPPQTFQATPTGDGTNGVLLWNFQLEAGGVASSPISTGAAAVTRAADQISFTIPSGVSQLTYTFDDNSTQVVSVSPGSYTIPTNLNRRQIKTIAYSTAGAAASGGIDISSLGGSSVPIFLAAQSFFSGRAGTLRVASNEWVGTPPSGYGSVNDFTSSDRSFSTSQALLLPTSTETAGVIVAGSAATANGLPAQSATAGAIISAAASHVVRLPAQLAAATTTTGYHVDGQQLTASPAQSASFVVYTAASQDTVTVAPGQAAAATVQVSAAQSLTTDSPSQAAGAVLASSRTFAAGQTTDAPFQVASSIVIMTATANQLLPMPLPFAAAGAGAHNAWHGNEELWAEGRTARFMRVHSFERR